MKSRARKNLFYYVLVHFHSSLFKLQKKNMVKDCNKKETKTINVFLNSMLLLQIKLNYLKLCKIYNPQLHSFRNWHTNAIWILHNPTTL